jgi:ABC-type nitrate/sulfonate/bicarbonate transport system ATPase subunit
MLHIKVDEKSFNETNILKNIDICLKQGEFISIIGPSGCGKSTLLNIISSLDNDYKGELTGDFSSLSFMFQDHRLLPWLSVKENLLLVSKTKDEKEIIDLLETINLVHILDEYPKNLSGGMARRVALVRSFINKPKLIVLDEPFISLDYPTSMGLKKELLTFYNKFKPTIILVTHDLGEAILLSNRVLFFSKNPAKVLLDFENLDYQLFDQMKNDEIKNKILTKYPKILEGVI